jgi:hypothetical protein
VSCADVEIAGFKAYEMEDEVTKDLTEFSLANAIFAALVEARAIRTDFFNDHNPCVQS